MKYCKVEIHKTRDGDTTRFAYPVGYDPRDHECLVYQNEGGNTEHVITLVPDDFESTPAGFEELSPVDAAALISGYIDADKDLPDEARAEFKTRRLELASQAAARAQTRTETRGKPFTGTRPATWS